MASYVQCMAVLAHQRDADLDARDIGWLAGALLDGGVPDLELGALLAMLQARCDSAPLLHGVLAALDARVNRWPSRAGMVPVAIGCYGATNAIPDLTPLLALLLARLGVPVLMHGPLHAGAGVSVALVLRELGIMPCASAARAERELDERSLAFVPDALLAPGLAALLSYRARVGSQPLLVTAARLIDPFERGGLVIAGANDQHELERMRAVLSMSSMRALVFTATEGEPFASPIARPRMEYWHCGTQRVLFETEASPSGRAPRLPPASEPNAIAAWISRACEGARAIPPPIVNQLAACLYATGYCDDFNQAKALAAIAAVRRHVA
ncbi:MAG: DNA-binding protein YbiB [Burkholderiales bacterium]|nr:DNA-binding protein YbiB [Burkholderiales bacterium]